MSISYNGSASPDEINYNNISLDRVIYNGVTVWEKYSEVTILDFSATPDIPSGISTAYTDPNYKRTSILVYKGSGRGEYTTYSTESNIAGYEIGYDLVNSGLPYSDVTVNSNSGFLINENNSWRKKTEINVTKYNTCIVEEASLYGFSHQLPFCPVGSVGAHQYCIFTMMNDNDLKYYLGDWSLRGTDPFTTYWWMQNLIFPNNHTPGSGYVDDKSIINDHFNPATNRPDDPYVGPDNASGGIKPGTYWSEIDWNHKLGFAFHVWNGSLIGAGIKGPIAYADTWDYSKLGIDKFRESKQQMESYGYEQNVKFSIQGLTGNRVIRCLLLPFSSSGTSGESTHYHGDSNISPQAGGGVYIYKVTLNTNKLPADREVIFS